MTDQTPPAVVFPPRPVGDEMPALVRAKDWSTTPLGAMDDWSPSLRMACDIVLSAGFPMALRWGPDFVLIYNDGYKPILGEKHPWALGLPAREAWSEVWAQIEPFHREILGGQRGAVFAEDVVLRIQRYEGQWEDAHFALGYSPTPDPTSPNGIGGIFVNAVETTARIQTENELREAQEALRSLNETLEHQVEARTRERDRVWANARDLMVVLGADGVFRDVSPAWTEVLGHAREEVIGRNFREFVYPDDADLTHTRLISATAGDDLTSFENRYTHKDGSPRWISWHSSAEDDLAYAYGRDITAEKAAEAELARAQEALRQSQKMEAIGQLTGGIAHDFNNMLAIVMGNLDLAARRVRRGEPGAERYLDNAQEGAKRAATLTQRLLAFSRQSPLSPRMVNLNELVASMSELLRRTLGEQVGFETVLAGGLWLTHVDANELESAILNLAVNARDAMPDGGELTVETANVYLDDHYAAAEVGLAPGQYVMVAVSDVGMGMAPETLEKVFDPFFTTKPVGKGTGLGLSMVYGFAKQSGGHVRIYSELGRGTTVKVYLPRHFGAADRPAPLRAASAPTAASRAEIVLVVEDEGRVRQTSCEALNELGYSVHQASSGEEALKLFDTLDHVDVLFTDIVMGGMTGRQLADALRLKVPGLKVLYTTGYTRNAVVHNGVLDPGVAFLPKPFTVEDLAQKLRAVLDA
ncbi:MAG TPA: ATP-binding protein [Caulobacteraceae bacterium]|jgi:PAS domain S-box-containing protein